MSVEALFMLTIIAAADPTAQVPLAAYQTYKQCATVASLLKGAAVFMHPDIALECKQRGLPDIELEEMPPPNGPPE